ncbi:hypothetical protein C8R45DRAFT_933262 [Mycena sanguinolenta]|nr:hypothetical protein C8R45DRAFT_933262 [Mycena sanguinolenta]
MSRVKIPWKSPDEMGNHGVQLLNIRVANISDTEGCWKNGMKQPRTVKSLFTLAFGFSNECSVPVKEVNGKYGAWKQSANTAQLLEDFGEKFDELGDLLLEYEADGLTGSACTCGRTGMIASVHFAVGHASWSPIFKIHFIGGATTREPHTAFTISLLKEFQLHNLESKKAAYDYLAAIRHLSDNAFTADVPKFKNLYAAFLCAVRVFNFLTLCKRSGSQVRSHLNQSQRTLDGNFQCNQFNKNTDPNDISLCAGKGYFPIDSEYKEYLNKILVSKEKSTCNYLKAVNKQDKRKFKNMAVTGTVNCQCSHVFILSCVDLHYGEQFANADMVLALALERHWPNEDFKFTLRFEVEDIDEVTTYDIACGYKIHLVERFGKHFPHLVPKVKKMRWGVPALHVQGHQDSCSYLFGTAYMQCVGHFHAFDLAEEMKDARQKYLEKRNHFIGLSILFSDRVEDWKKMPRTITKVGKEAVTVYKHKATKVPKTRVAQFLDEALKIQDNQ